RNPGSGTGPLAEADAGAEPRAARTGHQRGQVWGVVTAVRSGGHPLGDPGGKRERNAATRLGRARWATRETAAGKGVRDDADPAVGLLRPRRRLRGRLR